MHTHNATLHQPSEAQTPPLPTKQIPPKKQAATPSKSKLETIIAKRISIVKIGIPSSFLRNAAQYSS